MGFKAVYVTLKENTLLLKVRSVFNGELKDISNKLNLDPCLRLHHQVALPKSLHQPPVNKEKVNE